MNLIEQIKAHEGFRGDYYCCTAGKKSIGYGRNVENNPFSHDELVYMGRNVFSVEPMTKDEAEYLLINDLNNVIESLKDKISLDSLSKPRKAVCINMAFNLGVNGFMGFKKMLSALSEFDYDKAATEMLDSRWADQVKSRSTTLALQMSTGEWQ